MSGKHALVFGASGISGWRVIQELLRYPTPTTFASVTGLTNRPLSLKEALLPDDPRLTLASGIDLTSSSTTAALKAKVPHIADITHVYFYAYVDQPPAGQTLPEVNGALLENTLTALKELSPNLEHFTLQTGGKVYGPEHADKIKLPATPWKESLPRVQEPEIAAKIFYYRQLDILAKYAKGASWRWTEERPDSIIGFAPTSTAMNLSLLLGIFLSLWRKVNGPGSTVPYPGSKIAYERTNTETPMGGSARFQIFASLQGDKTHQQAFNIGAPTSRFADKWPQLAGAFGLVGTPPVEENGIDVHAWVKEHKDEWAELEKEYGLAPGIVEKAGWGFIVMLFIPFDRDYDLSRSREVGFTEKMDVLAGYQESWAVMAQAKYIPPA